jgi:hypothetical protein
MRKHIPFNVIIDDCNRQRFEAYDIMPRLMNEYKRIKRRQNCPKTYEEFKTFVLSTCRYFYWAKCEYEIILSPWVSRTPTLKIDAFYQINLNIDVVVDLLIKNLKVTLEKKPKKKIKKQEKKTTE